MKMNRSNLAHNKYQQFDPAGPFSKAAAVGAIHEREI